MSWIEETNEEEHSARPMNSDEIRKYGEIWQARLKVFPSWGFGKAWWGSRKFIRKSLNQAVKDAIESNESDWQRFRGGRLAA